jgi:hypothetical protein
MTRYLDIAMIDYVAGKLLGVCGKLLGVCGKLLGVCGKVEYFDKHDFLQVYPIARIEYMGISISIFKVALQL